MRRKSCFFYLYWLWNIFSKHSWMSSPLVETKLPATFACLAFISLTYCYFWPQNQYKNLKVGILFIRAAATRSISLGGLQAATSSFVFMYFKEIHENWTLCCCSDTTSKTFTLGYIFRNSKIETCHLRSVGFSWPKIQQFLKITL